jgi:transposase InsO family protein
LKGPEFLYLDESQWPTTQEPEPTDEGVIDEEWVAVTTERESSVPDVQRFSSWQKLIRATAWCQRFIKNCRVQPHNRQKGPLTVEELEGAEKLWWLEVQSSCFGKDRKSNRTGGKFSYRLEKLSPILDSDGVIRVAGRIERAEGVQFATRSPVILDGKHRYVELMIQHLHRNANHQGIETVINRLRENYWIIKCRLTVKQQFANCLYCKRRKAKPAQPLMGQLPIERFAHNEKPFTNTGVDFFGPFLVTVGRRTEKRYGVLFTCLTIRAVHLEVAHDLTTSSCIMAIRRMVSRRGTVRKMFSDNGTNLRGADRELRQAIEELDDTELYDELANERMEWHFIPPAAPHMGGAWERMIGTVKRALLTVMAQRKLTDEILLTVFAEVENIVNSRPLTHISEDHSDPLSLTPNHFLLGSPDFVSAPGAFGNDGCNWRRRWRVAQHITDHYWKRWLKEYVPTLVSRSKWTRPERNLAVGDVAVIDDPCLPRGQWPLGVIDEVLPGRDGVVRTVDIRVAKGVLRRPAVKIHPFIRVGDVEPTRGGECDGGSDSEEEFYGFDKAAF